MKKRMISILTALALCLSLLPVTSLPAGAEEQIIEMVLRDEADITNTGWYTILPGNLPKQETTVAAGGGTLTWTPVLGEDGIAVSGTVTLKNARINGGQTGIVLPVPFTLVLDGDNTITTSDAGSHDNAMAVADALATRAAGSLTIQGPGSLTVKSAGWAINPYAGLTIEKGATVTVECPCPGLCLSTGNGDITIEDSTVYAKVTDDGSTPISDGVLNADPGLNPGTGNITIKNSRVTAITEKGNTIIADNNINFIDSHVVAIGSTDTYSGIIGFGDFRVSGGTLYMKNNAGGYDLYPDFANTIATDGAVIFYAGTSYYLIQRGDNVQYANCTYNETDGTITPGPGYMMGNVIWNDNIVFPGGLNLEQFSK